MPNNVYSLEIKSTNKNIYISNKTTCKIPFSETKIKQIKIKNAKNSNTHGDKCIMKLIILISIHTHTHTNVDDDRTNYLKK